MKPMRFSTILLFSLMALIALVFNAFSARAQAPIDQDSKNNQQGQTTTDSRSQAINADLADFKNLSGGCNYQIAGFEIHPTFEAIFVVDEEKNKIVVDRSLHSTGSKDGN